MVGMIGKLTAKTSALAIATIAAGALCVNSMKDNNLKEENQVQTEQTENPQNRKIPMPWVYGTLSALGLLGTIRSGKKLQHQKHLEAGAAKYNIPVGVYQDLTELGDYDCVLYCWPGLGISDANNPVKELSEIEETIDEYKKRYNLDIFEPDDEKNVRTFIAKLKNKAKNQEKITENDEKVLIELLNKRFFPYI